MTHFKNKVAIVTGSGMGIGKAIAKELCLRGASVVLNGRNPDRLKKTFDEFSAQGFRVLAVQADVTKHSDCELLITKAVQEFGGIDILITNAGVSMREYFENLQPEIFATVVESNIHGSAFPALKALPEIKKRKGSIVFISSAAGMIGLPTASAYSVGKMGLTALAQSLKIELNSSGVHIGIVHVGFTKNDDDKRVLNANGELIPVASRPAYLQQTQEQVANAVLSLIRKRKFKKVLTVTGKLNAYMVRFFPSVVMSIISYSQRRMKDMYK